VGGGVVREGSPRGGVCRYGQPMALMWVCGGVGRVYEYVGTED
jgi:hypothetical protein